MNRFALTRWLLATTAFGVSFGFSQPLNWSTQNTVFEAARSVSSVQYFQSGRVFIGPAGPFSGDRAVDDSWNFLWRQAGWLPQALSGLGAATFVVFIAEWHTRRRNDGQTRCGFCGYALRGVRQPICPECGTRI